MAQRGKFDVRSTVHKLMLAALAVVAFQGEPSYAYCLCAALAYCSLVSTTDLIISGSVIGSTKEEEEEYPDDSFFVGEYRLKIDHVYQDEADFTVPDTPRNIKFTSSGQGLESCRLVLDVDSENVVGITVEDDGSFTAHDARSPSPLTT